MTGRAPRRWRRSVLAWLLVTLCLVAAWWFTDRDLAPGPTHGDSPGASPRAESPERHHRSPDTPRASDATLQGPARDVRLHVRVTSPGGAPVDGATVALHERGPGGEASIRTSTTDSDGTVTFDGLAGEAGDVEAHMPGFEGHAARSGWEVSSSDRVDLVLPVEGLPSLEIVVHDVSTDRRLVGVRFHATSRDGGHSATFSSDSERCRVPVVEVPWRDGAWLEAEVIDSWRAFRVWTDLPRERDTRVTLVVQSSDVVMGRVVGPDGAPLDGVLVYGGTQIRARGDEPFKPFRPERIRDGVRTGQDGRFELRGSPDEITVWRTGSSVATQELGAGTSFTLRPTVDLVVRFDDGGVLVRIGDSVRLDRGAEVQIDERRQARFTDVSAGVRGLSLPDGRYLYVTVGASGAGVVTVPPPIPRVAFAWSHPDHRPADGAEVVLVGRDAIGSVLVGRMSDGELALEAALPGRYVVLSQGRLGTVTIDPGATSATVETSTRRLRLASDVTRIAYVVPWDAHDLIRLMAGRVQRIVSQPAPGSAVRAVPDGELGVGLDRMAARHFVPEGAGSAEDLVIDLDRLATPSSDR